MKRYACLLLLLCLFVTMPAFAADDLTGRPIADGVVTAAEFSDITAPFSGTLTSFDLSSGDTVEAGDVLMSYVTETLYAPEDGTVKAVFAAEGDDASAVIARYGALLGLEPNVSDQVDASTSGADSDNENKILHLGETLYFKTSGTDKEEGIGRVTQVNGSKYKVDVLSGSFDLDDDVTLYRKATYDSHSCVGKGTIQRRETLLLTGTGRVNRLYIKEGASVKANDPLIDFVSANASPNAYSSEITSTVSGVIRNLSVVPGQQVWKGEALCRIDRTDALEVTAQADEVDLGALKVGDWLPVTLDMEEGTVLNGAVTYISGLGVTKQNAAYYEIHVSIPQGSALLGASASVYLPAK